VTDKSDLVERRLKYIKRQIELDKAAVNVRFRGMQPEGSGPVNRHGMPTLPVGQHEVKNWPVLDLGETPVVTLAEWKLEVGGLVANPFTLRWDQFLALPQVDDVSDFHCVTTWSRFNNHWRGVRFKTIAELAVPDEEAQFVECTGYDFAPGTYIPYTTNLPLARALEEDVLLVHTWEGHPLPTEHGGPCRMITPKLYAWKGAKWIRKIEFLAEDRRGFWEVRGYSNSAEPWFDDRYSTEAGD
jgi:DMSO/TMAO reductase YedYZ molybdopterin-dependent catalytic subunit